MKVYFIGAGPGAKDLITVRGHQLIQEADVIFYADSLVNEQLLEDAKPSCEIFKTARMHLQEMIDMMVARVKEGKNVIRLHTGDPSVFGAIMEQISLLKREGIEVEIVPGVSSVFASAAALGAELTIPDLTQTVILTRAEGRTPVPQLEKLSELAKHHCTIALFLSATLTKKAVKELLNAGWDEQTPAAAVYKATWPDEKIVRTTIGQLDEEMKKHGIRKQAMILVGWALDEQIHEKDYRSKLYDPQFTHGFRKGVMR
ncbi:precorrin-4 C(11)-methyltransferase [Aeribacillus alveayuensis]|uniref:Precorrin-4/cobalt-precorrin-4 C11-methyltransferase n=1 Tax=Aeribacillus alveayuensis TaxID=279215 RepID=A0ABT9VJ61_9BACI|nr:precorrin-4/cobalt-precorrin-4 C11-methyltransferase [Bacillus alveayuensis]